MKAMGCFLKKCALGVVLANLFFPVTVSADSVTPETFTATIEQGNSVSVRRTVNITKEVTSAKADVFFLFDTTGSMGELLDSVKAKATEILNNVATLGDVAFGVAYFEDFPQEPYGENSYFWGKDTPYELVRDITTSASAARAAINALELGSGNDLPEAGLYALAQAAQTTNWREDATRIIIMFGDAVGHDGKLDPNYPGKVGLDDVISILTANNIIVEAVNANRNCWWDWWEGAEMCNSIDESVFYPQLSGQTTAITQATGGQLLDGTDSGNIVSIIDNALTDAFAEYTEVSLEPAESLAGLGVAVSPEKITGNFDRSRERSFTFDITYTGIDTGVYELDLIAKVDSGAIGVVSDVITVVRLDCNGDPDGTAFLDGCGNCVEGNTGKSACEQDCDGEWGGAAYFDECGDCVEGNTGELPCDQDCNGQWGGTAYADECDQCVGGSTGNVACEQDCHGEWGGAAYTDECDVCVGGSTGNIACEQDCDGEWGGSAYTDECGDCVGGSTGKSECEPTFSGGVFTVGPAGLVEVDWLYDGGMYQGELAIFTLNGMEDLIPGSEEFVAEAARRALSSSEEGYVVISDTGEGARFDGALGEPREWNSGPYSLKRLPMNPGDRFATLLVPNATVARLSQNPATTSTHVRPLFSLIASNPAYGMFLGQIADVNGMGKAFAYEDMNANISDLDYNDLILQITGADIDNVPTLDDMAEREDGEDKAARSKRGRDKWYDWRTDSELGRQIMAHVETEPEAIRMAVSLEGGADLLLFDEEGNELGKDGGAIPGATFGYDAEGNALVFLPGLPEEHRIVIRGLEAESGTLRIRVTGGQTGVSETSTEVDIIANTVLKAELPAVEPASPEELNIEVGTSLAGPYDFDGNDVVDDADIRKVSDRWGACKGDADYDAFLDVDGNGRINLLDIMQVVNSKR